MRARPEPTKDKPFVGLHSKGRLQPYLKWKSLTVINTLAYYDMEFITVVKSFIVQSQQENDSEVHQLGPVLQNFLQQ